MGPYDLKGISLVMSREGEQLDTNGDGSLRNKGHIQRRKERSQSSWFIQETLI